MQTNHFNFLKIIFLASLLFMQLLDSQAQRIIYLQADSLFSQRNFEEAQKKYEQILDNDKIINPNVYLKLAYIHENKAEMPITLYYLNLYYLKHPDEKIFNKMSQIAEENSYKGFEQNDLNFIIMLIRQYANYLVAAFLLLAIYVFGVLVYKKMNAQTTLWRHKVFFAIYLIMLVLLINLPNSYRSVIIKNNKSYLRDYPSAAAQIKGVIGEGHRLNVLNSEDIWYHVVWNSKLVYIKATDVWLLK